LYIGTDGNWKHKNSDFSALVEMYDGVFNVYNTASGTADATATLQNRLKIDASGNVGIGTTAVTSPGLWYDANPGYLAISHWATPPTPAAMLHLSDNSNDLDVPQIRIEGRENPGDTKLDISVKDPGVRFNLIEGPSGDASNGFGLMEFKTNAAVNVGYPTRGGFKFITEAHSSNLVITNTGDIGISIATPRSKLSINSQGAPATSTGNMANTGLTIHNGTGGTAVQLGTYDAGSWGYIQSGYVNNATVAREFRIMNGANYTLTLSNTGKVGIGKTDPSGELHVDSGLAPCDIHFTTGSSGGTGYDVNLNMTGGANNSEMNINMGIAGNADREQIKTYQSTMRFRANDTERMRIGSNGTTSIGNIAAANFQGDEAVLELYNDTGSHDPQLYMRDVSSQTATGRQFAVVEGGIYLNGTGDQIKIPYTTQGGSWRKHLIIFDFVGVMYNNSSNTYIGGGKVAMSTLSTSHGASTLYQNYGMVTSVTHSPSTGQVFINLSSSIPTGLSNGNGIFMSYKILSETPDGDFIDINSTILV
jgi:hypothetical protein